MITASRTTGPDTRPDPEKDRFADPMPGRITEVFLLLQILTAYGRHIAGLLDSAPL